MKRYTIISSPKQLYRLMLADIKKAKKSVYLETYIYDKDKIGAQFRDALTKKAQEGIKVYILIDAWGAQANKNYFKELIAKGGKVKFFRELRYVIRVFSKNHERNHRKLLLIDDNISYMGSANITSKCLKWRELVLRLKGKITKRLKHSFKQHWKMANDWTIRRFDQIHHIADESFEIIQDFPSELHKLTERRYIELINKSQEKVRIVTPYFVPSLGIRRAFRKALKRGVKIRIIIPKKSDVPIVDLVRTRYLGKLHRQGVKISYYHTGQLHAKLLIVDDQFFLLGSSNLDYRSFMYQYEINLIGKDKKLITSLIEYFRDTLEHSIPFNYTSWLGRSKIIQRLEKITDKIKEYL